MTPAAPRSVRRRLARFARDNRAIAAVEFAMVLPIMISLYLGGVEMSQGIAIDRKTTLVARAVSDLVSQSTANCISNADMAGILSVASKVVAPYDVTKLKVTVQHVYTATSTPTVEWSDRYDAGVVASPGGVTTLVNFPAGLATADTAVILATAQYRYTPAIGHYITGFIDLGDKVYMRPRNQPKLLRKVTC